MHLYQCSLLFLLGISKIVYIDVDGACSNGCTPKIDDCKHLWLYNTYTYVNNMYFIILFL